MLNLRILALYGVPIGRENLALGKRFIWKDDNLQQCPWATSVLLRATDVAESRPTIFGNPAFLDPPP